MSVRVTLSVFSSREKANSTQRWLLWAEIITPFLFAAAFTIDGLLTPGYSAADEAVSYLDLGIHGWIQRANFILFGLLLFAFLPGYISRVRPSLGQVWLTAASIFFVLSSLGWIMVGLFVPNPFLAPQVRWPGALHQLSVIVAFLLFATACFIPGVKSVRIHRWRIYGVYRLILVLPQVIFSPGTIAYLFNQNTFGNVNSPGNRTMNRVGLLVGPRAWLRSVRSSP